MCIWNQTGSNNSIISCNTPDLYTSIAMHDYSWSSINRHEIYRILGFCPHWHSVQLSKNNEKKLYSAKISPHDYQFLPLFQSVFWFPTMNKIYLMLSYLRHSTNNPTDSIHPPNHTRAHTHIHLKQKKCALWHVKECIWKSFYRHKHSFEKEIIPLYMNTEHLLITQFNICHDTIIHDVKM